MADVYIVNPHLQVVRCGNDELLVKQGTRSLFSETISDELATGILGDLVDDFRRGADADEVLEAYDAKAEVAKNIIEGLVDRGVLVSPDSEIGALYASTFFGADLEPASVTILGSGSLGSMIADGLREAGVGTVRMEDPRSGDGDSTFDVDQVFEGAELLVVAWEQLSPRLFTEVNLASIDASVPWLASYLDGHEAIVGPTTIPGESACWFEFLTQTESSITQKDAYHVFKDHLSDVAPADTPVFSSPPLRSISAGLAVASALRTLTGQPTPTVNRAIRVDIDRFTIDYQHVLRLPRCPACGTQRAAYRQLFL